MAPPTRSRVDPLYCLIGDWVPGEWVPGWGVKEDYIFIPPGGPDDGAVEWKFKRVIRDYGGERVIAWERVS